MNRGIEYLQGINALVNKVIETQAMQITKTAELIFETYKNGGMLYIFGTGHSHMLGLELFYRAGGFAKVYPILEEGLMLHNGALRSTSFERIEGYANVLLKSYPVKKGDTIIVISNSGRNALPVEMAIEAKKAGMNVIALTNMEHTTSQNSRHKSGKRLFELADVILDNCGCLGDASLSFNTGNFAPTSTAVGSAMLWAIMCEVLESLENENIDPQIFKSSNIDGGEEYNNKLIKKYIGIIKPL